MTSILKTITINTEKMQDMVSFFSALGVAMQVTNVKNGSVSYRGNMGDLEIGLFSIAKREKRLSPDLSLRIQVENISEVLIKLQQISGVEVLMSMQELPFGKMAVVLDPDGHSVELYDER